MEAIASDSRGGRRRRPTAAQVVALGLVAAAFGSAIWLLDERPVAEEVELLPGTVLPASELAMVEAAFDRAELLDHRTDSGRVFVPRRRQASYMRALVDAEALPREFGSSLRRALENESPWRSRVVQEEMLRVAIQDELAHVICSMPGIERAAVLYDGGEPLAFPGAAPQRAATASVNVRPEADAVLEPERVQAIRVLVAASIAGLEPERVAVTDLRSGQVSAGPLEGAAGNRGGDAEFVQRGARERHLATKIRQALGFVQGVVVDVTLPVMEPEPPAAIADPRLPRQRQRVADANAPAEVDADTPPDVQPAAREVTPSVIVNVAVPERYLRAAAGGPSATTDEMMHQRERLATHVRNLLPPPRHPDDHRILVTAYPTPAVSTPVAKVGDTQTVPAAFPGGVMGGLREAFERGDPSAVPRQVWLVVAAAGAAIVLWLVLREGPAPRGRRERPRRRGQATMDWQELRGPLDQNPVESGAPLTDLSEPNRGVAA